MFFHARANGDIYTTDFSLQDNEAEIDLGNNSHQRTVVLNCSSYELAQECFEYFAPSDLS